jgi:predicted methyltransferase
MKTRARSFALALLASLLALPASADERLRSVIADPQRPTTEAERDRYRHPYETLTFFGIRPNMTVIELSPGTGWYTEILGPYLKDEGKLVAAHWNLQGDVPPYYHSVRAGFDSRIANTARFGKVEVIPFDPPKLASLGAPESADLVLTFRNVHSYKSKGTFGDMVRAAHAVLKPGGVLGIVGHRLPEDREDDPRASTGYVKQSWVVKQVEAAGFRLEAASEVNANPADTADHPKGVWTLPPSLTSKEDAERFLQIGESDRFTLKFVKK